MTVHLPEKLFHALIYCFLFLLVTAAFINIQYGTDNLAVLSVFSADEPFAVQLLARNLIENRVDPQGFYNYGYFYHTVAFYLIKILERFNYAIDERLIAVVCRLISVESYVLLLFLTYQLTKMVSQNSTLALYAAWFLASTPDLYYWAQYIHPDLLQAALVAAAAYIAWSRHRFSQALLASIIAGAAFGTKYSGIFILPFLILPSALAFLNDIHRQRKILFKDYRKLVGVAFGMFALFLAAWIVTNPTIIKNFGEASKDILYSKGQLVTGARGWIEPTNPLLWFPTFYSEFKTGGSLLVVIGLIVLVVVMIRKRTRYQEFLRTPLYRTLFSMGAYVGIVSLYFALTVNARVPRYIFHLLPFIVMLAFTGLSQLVKTVCHTKHRQWGCYLGCMLCIFPLTMHTIHSMDWASQKYYHQYMQATTWIENHFSPDTPILADSYSYQSPYFTKFQKIWGVDEQALQYYQPELVIINNKLSGRWSWKIPGTTFEEQQFALGPYVGRAQEIHDFHIKLFSPSSPYEIIYEDTEIVVLQRKASGK
ncbi:4-amino-4-deoxy-L-arabinose transferase and related glycosyltransferase of PMT family [Candidatus Vecturithrix granuli]|uniref:4-amino-4-deoxy-L-arabinose transferase and related glycosyltransferase of PMT family n=1 Tax=Vecturithrix granuli TaxID=1499967 RepID=A0A081BXF5_VECG1|nr:4-amino-4-deoxy-L-arabinose transferase and related glycosyltransferase of PMT family [Candidatus Vecturithrix granuli]